MIDHVEIISERLGQDAVLKPIVKVYYDRVVNEIVIERVGQLLFRLSPCDARKLGDALTVGTGQSFLRKNRIRD